MKKIEVIIDPKAPPSPGGVWNREGYQYTTLGYKLKDTFYLIDKAEDYRADNDLPPVVYWDEDMESWLVDGFYDFWAEINDKPGDRFEVRILYRVNYDDEDEKTAYLLPLTEREQASIFRKLDQQCKTMFGKSCRKMLAGARAKYTAVKDYDLRLRSPATVVDSQELGQKGMIT